jgi:diacylglycerol kinase (ATP)
MSVRPSMRGGTSRRRLDVQRHNRRVPIAPLVILNPVAGAGRAARLSTWLRERLRELSDADLVETRAPGHAQELARDAARDGRGRIVVVGGDGTLQEAANGLLDGAAAGGGPSLGIVPGGSGNDLARSIGLARSADGAWRDAIGERTVVVDALRAMADDRSRWFVSAGGAGFDAQVAAATVRHTGWRRGHLGYLLTAVGELWRYRNRVVRLTIDGERLPEVRSLFVAFANGAYYGGGMKICPRASIDDGALDVCVVGDLSTVAALGQIPALYRGRHVRHPRIQMRRARTLQIEADASVAVHLDGEPFGELPISIEVAGAALRVARSTGGTAGVG